jgi:hypothetical protein
MQMQEKEEEYPKEGIMQAHSVTLFKIAFSDNLFNNIKLKLFLLWLEVF